jgi:hypothetical protein
MKSRKLLILLTALLAITQAVRLQASEIAEIGPGEYYWMKSEGKSSFYYKKLITPGKLPVVTLKRVEGQADFNLGVYKDSRFSRPISSGTSRGAGNELLILPILEEPAYVYIYATNVSNTYGKYELYVDQIDIFELVGEALAVTTMEYMAEEFIKGLFGIDDSSSPSAKNDANRAAAALVASLQDKNLSNTPKAMLINELRREYVGGGFLSSFMVNFGVSLIDRIYSRY